MWEAFKHWCGQTAITVDVHQFVSDMGTMMKHIVTHL
jgi:hypothetical protein